MDEGGKKAAYTSMSAASTTYPAVTVSNISTNCQLETGFIIGTSSSSTGTVVLVEAQFDAGGYAAATGTNSWTQAIPAGASTWNLGSQHTIDVRCRDDAGNYSSVLSTTIRKAANKDVNGDGYADAGVAAYNWIVNGTNDNTGRAYIYYGSASGISAAPAATITG